MNNLPIIKTTCPYCGVGCGISASVDEKNRLVSISGDVAHPANFGRLCSKGSALGDTIELKGRLLQPKVNGQEVEWSEALDKVAAIFSKTIAKYGPAAVAIYGSGQLLTEDYYVANKLMKGFIGSGNMDTNSRLCMSSSVAGHKRAFGSDTVPGCYEDFEHAEPPLSTYARLGQLQGAAPWQRGARRNGAAFDHQYFYRVHFCYSNYRCISLACRICICANGV